MVNGSLAGGVEVVAASKRYLAVTFAAVILPSSAFARRVDSTLPMRPDWEGLLVPTEVSRNQVRAALRLVKYYTA